MRVAAGSRVVILATMVLASALPAAGAALASVSTPSHILGADASDRGTVTSSNWAGYAAENTAGSVTHTVAMSAGVWTQTTINCAAGKTTDVSTWVGIDGYSTTTVEQTGSSGDCSHGAASYYAWYELYPAGSVTISSFVVHAGDKLSAWVNYSSSTSKFTMTIMDGSQKFSHSGAASSAKRASAECIVERDTVGSSLNKLSKFTTDSFSSCTATINGATGGIGTFAQVNKINMTGNTGNVIALTSALTSNSSFKDTWKGYT